MKEMRWSIMCPSPGQEAGNSASSAYSSASAPSDSAAYGLSGNVVSQYDNAAQSYELYQPYNTPEQAEQAAYQSPGTPVSERRGLLVDLVAYPGRSVHALFQPSLHTFASEALSARWSVFWISIIALPVLSSLIALPLVVTSHHVTSGMLTAMLLSPLIIIPLLFFIVQGMIWPLARYYQGGGTFLEQCYTTFLSLAPPLLLGSVVAILIATNSISPIGTILVLLEFLLFIYCSVLLVVALKAIHGLTTWEAIALSILPFFFLLAVLIIVLVVVAASSSDSSGGNSSNSNSSNNSNNNNNQDDYSRSRSGMLMPWWWWSSGVGGTSNSANQGSGSKIQWLCPACQYRRWLKRGSVEVAEMTCLRCGAPMQMTAATR